MAKDIFIDIETYSPLELKDCGVYRYAEHEDFRILLVSYAIDNNPVICVDLASGEELPEEFEDALFDENCKKHAHNANFERQCFRAIGYDIPIEQWYCTAVKAAYCGLPFSLDEVSKMLDIENKKLDTGKSLIRYFSMPCKPTKINGGRTRNLPHHDPVKWAMYKEYNMVDVEAEREIYNLLKCYDIPESDREIYILDQQINDSGILIDLDLASAAIEVDAKYTDFLLKQSSEVSGLSNPNSVKQISDYIANRAFQIRQRMTKKDIAFVDTPVGESFNPEKQSTAKAAIDALLKMDCIKADKNLTLLLENRLKLSRSSVKKYHKMIACANNDGRVRGTFQFYGANRTGRWAGRLLQLQNLSKNHLDDIDGPRDLLRTRNWQDVELIYDDVSDILSQLVRTALIAPDNMTFAVADFSAIEARVVSWLADESWRIDVFKGDGKIYEAAASRMFGVPISMVTKGSDYRAKAKNAELALGYQGSLGAMKRMGGDKMGMSDPEMMSIVRMWRDANPKIVQLWQECEDCAHEAVKYQRRVVGTCKNIIFDSDGNNFMIELPSGRRLFYRNPRFIMKKVGKSRNPVKLLCYDGIVQETKIWGDIDTYGGKLVENIVQAISRDLIAYSMLQLSKNGYKVVMHVHDEAIAEVPLQNAENHLKRMEAIMGTPPSWASDLPLNADGYITEYYKKD